MKTVPLKDVCQISMGQAPDGSSYNDLGEGFPLIAGAGDFGPLSPKPKKFTTEPTRVSEVDDVILCIRATIGDLNWSDKAYCLGRGVAGLRPDGNKLDKHYLWHWLTSQKDFLFSQGTGSTFKQISRSTIDDLKIPLPPLPEQKRIAAILDKADAIRRKRQQAVKLTEELLRSVFLDMFGDPVTNPKGWETSTVQNLCKIIVDCPHTTPKYEGDNRIYPCIRTSDLQRGFLDYSTAKYVDEVEYGERIARHQPVAGDVLYSREGERFGIAAMVEEGTNPCLGQRMMLLQANPAIATPAFLWGLMNSKAIYHQATCLVGGATSPHVNVGDIKKLRAVMPPLLLQSKFSSIVKTVFGVRKKQIQSRAAADTLLNSLLHRAFKGELFV